MGIVKYKSNIMIIRQFFYPIKRYKLALQRVYSVGTNCRPIWNSNNMLSYPISKID